MSESSDSSIGDFNMDKKKSVAPERKRTEECNSPHTAVSPFRKKGRLGGAGFNPLTAQARVEKQMEDSL